MSEKISVINFEKYTLYSLHAPPFHPACRNLPNSQGIAHDKICGKLLMCPINWKNCECYQIYLFSGKYRKKLEITQFFFLSGWRLYSGRWKISSKSKLSQFTQSTNHIFAIMIQNVEANWKKLTHQMRTKPYKLTTNRKSASHFIL